jgi:hypothetical protein
VLRGKSSDSKARAAGYNHTYFDNEGLDLEALSCYASDEEIAAIAIEASEEADSLFILLGVHPDDLHVTENARPIHLPSIAAWFDTDDGFKSDDGDDDDESDDYEGGDEGGEGGDVDKLQTILNEEEHSPISRRAVIDNTCIALMGAALAIAAEESAVV